MLRMGNMLSQLRCMSRCMPSSCKLAMARSLHNEQSQVLPLVNMWRKKLKEVGVPDVEDSLRALIARVLKVHKDKMQDYSEVVMNPAQIKEFESLCEMRHSRMPVQHILGEAEFMGMKLKVTPSVFVPRPLTEEFVSTILDNIGPDINNMLEVGCGTGAISLAVLKYKKKMMCAAIERCAVAISLAQENAKRLELKSRFYLYHHTMDAKHPLPRDLKNVVFDIIVSNPPYAKPWEFEFLPPEITMFENLHALNGGNDGLNLVRMLIDVSCKYLRDNGSLWLEVGNDHPQVVRALLHHKYQGRLECKATYKDRTGAERFVEITKLPDADQMAQNVKL